MDPIKLLEQQHEETLAALETLRRSEPGPERKKLFTTMQQDLVAHMAIEEELFYPTVAENQPEGEPIAEAYEEHSGARVAMDRCSRALAEVELFAVRISVLKEMVSHHIEEERNEIFPLARRAVEKSVLDVLGEDMAARFEKAKKGRSPASELNRKSTNRARSALEGNGGAHAHR